MAKNFIQKVDKSIAARGTEGVCTGSNFGGPSCPPGSKRYVLAQTFKKMGARRHAKKANRPMPSFKG